ncbi:hypothetical protein MVEN_00697200 [Mycena venus]|uniref:Uncharacterized protein n=1 Tax=Mycena venus TaxID=2733690 RepID=A0A8H7D5J7_9AGAR|nr:hypothetical protein MVEN_00697200 [Mycena venus]
MPPVYSMPPSVVTPSNPSSTSVAFCTYHLPCIGVVAQLLWTNSTSVVIICPHNPTRTHPLLFRSIIAAVTGLLMAQGMRHTLLQSLSTKLSSNSSSSSNGKKALHQTSQAAAVSRRMSQLYSNAGNRNLYLGHSSVTATNPSAWSEASRLLVFMSTLFNTVQVPFTSVPHSIYLGFPSQITSTLFSCFLEASATAELPYWFWSSVAASVHHVGQLLFTRYA